MVYLFLFVALAQFFFWLLILHAGYGVREVYAIDEKRHSPVSVIVCFRNEEATLGLLIDRILAQTYPGPYELLLVDDNSTDTSASVVHPFAILHDHVHLLDPGKTRPGKKDALAYGISQARYDHLLLTDADCVPGSSHWLWLMTEPLRWGQELVLGVSPLVRGRIGGWLGRWQHFESVYVSIKYLGFARRRQPFMGVGRNLAYTRAYYERAGGFAAHADLPGGDDDLLVAGHAHPERTATVIDPAAWTHSEGQPSWSAYFRQRARHQSTGTHYPGGIARYLGAIALSHGLFYLLGFFLLFTSLWPWAVLIYGLRMLVVQDTYRQAMKGAAAGAKKGWRSGVGWGVTVLLGDALVGPMYLYLTVSSVFKSKNW